VNDKEELMTLIYQALLVDLKILYIRKLYIDQLYIDFDLSNISVLLYIRGKKGWIGLIMLLTTFRVEPKS